MRLHIVYLLCIVLLLGFLPVKALAGTVPTEITPSSGPPGTQVQLSPQYCSTIYLQAPWNEFPYDAGAVFSGTTAYITIPQDYATGTVLTIGCGYYGGGDDVGEDYRELGTFTVTSPCQLDMNTSTARRLSPGGNPLAAYSPSGQIFQGTDLTIDANGRFVAVVDVVNNSGQVLRLVISSPDANRLLGYLNSVRLDFYAAPATGSTDSCSNVTGRSQPASASVSADIDVRFELVPSGNVGSNQGYIVYVDVDPRLNYSETDYYRSPENHNGGASAGIRTQRGEALLTMWSDNGSFYSAIDSPNEGNPPSSLVSPTASVYNVLIYGVGNQNEYRVSLSFAAMPCTNCTVLHGVPFTLLNNGVGLSNGAAMNFGNIQVEGYCTRKQQSASQDGNYWYCSGTRLNRDNYTEICRLTYQGHPYAVAVQDGGGNVASYNWRCYDANSGSASNTGGSGNNGGSGNSGGGGNSGGNTTVSTSRLCAASPAPRLRIGQQARVSRGSANNMRNSPNGSIIGKIPPGGAVSILDGPACGVTDHTFWQVNYNGQVGWTAEGEGGTYWLEPA